jgi:hypothetical protein
MHLPTMNFLVRQKRNEEKKNKECNLREKFRISIENIITRKGVNGRNSRKKKL